MTRGKLALAALPTALALVTLAGVDATTTEWLFVHTTYYLSMVAVLCWAGTYLHRARDLDRVQALAWMKDNWPGLAVALVVTLVAAFAVEPALRMLSDEANLVGTSKNLFHSKEATFTVSGKNYYGSYWDIDVVIDRRPTLFPFFVSLVHAVLGYSYENAFVLNLAVLPVFVLVAYRLAKSLGGETFGVVASLLVVAHPITLTSVRSGGFDFFAAFFGLLVLHAFLELLRERSAERLAALWMNLCLFAGIRYESALFLPLVVALLFVFGAVSWERLRPYAFVYALTPAYLLPRIWQSSLRGNVPEQEPGTVTFSAGNFLHNVHDYFAPILSPLESHPFHATVLIALGIVGCFLGLRSAVGRLRSGERSSPELRFAVVTALWMLLQLGIVCTYVWGRSQTPSAARLFLATDAFFSFAAAWAVTRALERFRPLVAVLFAAAVFVAEVPATPQYRALNRLTQTRESAETWNFFERLNEKRILVVTDRPHHFTIMNYGAMDFATAKNDAYLFTALARRLFYDVYVIQQLELSTKKPRPGYEIWPERTLETVLEFQNDANVLVRVSRVLREAPAAPSAPVSEGGG